MNSNELSRDELVKAVENLEEALWMAERTPTTVFATIDYKYGVTAVFKSRQDAKKHCKDGNPEYYPSGYKGGVVSMEVQ